MDIYTEAQASSHNANVDEDYIGSATLLEETLEALSRLAVDDYDDGDESQRYLRPMSGDHGGAGVSVPDGSPPPAGSVNAPYSQRPQSAPPNPTPSQTPVKPALFNAYRQLHNLMLAPNTPPTYHARVMQLGFRIDESGALIGAAGLVFDSKGQPGIGATVPPRTHAQAWARLDAAASGPSTITGAPAQGSAIPQNLGTPTHPPTGTPSGSSNVWWGQIAYLLQQRVDQEPALLHFSVIAVGVPNQNIETHRWPTPGYPLTVTTGFKPLPLEMATQLYNSPIPFGQMVVDPCHAVTDTSKWQVFQKIITAGWCIFYEFPSDSGSLPHNPMQGSHGVLFFSTTQAPGRVLFKVFVNQLCPPAFTRDGLPAGPRLIKNPAYGNDPNETPQNPVAAATTAAGVNPGPGAAASVPEVEAVPSMSSGTAPNINLAGVLGLDQATVDRVMNQMALARLGVTPARLATAPLAQKRAIFQQVQQMILGIRQNMATGGAGAGFGMQRPPGMSNLEHLQAVIRLQLDWQQQQQQQQEQQG